MFHQAAIPFSFGNIPAPGCPLLGLVDSPDVSDSVVSPAKEPGRPPPGGPPPATPLLRRFVFSY